MADAKRVKRINVWRTNELAREADEASSADSKLLNRLTVWPTEAAAASHTHLDEEGGGGDGYDDSWAPELTGGRLMIFADFLTPFFDDGESQGADAVPIDSDEDAGVTFDSDHIQENFGYITQGSGEGWVLKPDAFALIDPTDFCVIVQTNNGADTGLLGEGTITFSNAALDNPYFQHAFNPSSIEDYDGDKALTERPILSQHRYCATFRFTDNVVAMDGVLSDVVTSERDSTGGDLVIVGDLPSSGVNSPIEYFAVISPSLTDEEIATWTGDLPAIVYGNAAESDLDFKDGSLVVDGVTLSDITDLLDWQATDTATFVAGQGLVATPTQTIEVYITNSDVCASMRANFTLLLDLDRDADVIGFNMQVPQGDDNSLSFELGNLRVTDGDAEIAFTDPGVGRHKIALRLVGTAATLYIDGALIGTETFHHEFQSPQNIYLNIAANTDTYTLRRLYITAPIDNAAMAALTTV